MKKVNLLSYFGKDIFIETDEADTIDYATKFERHVRNMADEKVSSIVKNLEYIVGDNVPAKTKLVDLKDYIDVLKGNVGGSRSDL